MFKRIKIVASVLTVLTMNSTFAMKDYSYAANPMNMSDHIGKQHNIVMEFSCADNRESVVGAETFASVLRDGYLQMGDIKNADGSDKQLEFLQTNKALSEALKDASRTQTALFDQGTFSKTGAGYVASLIRIANKLDLKGYTFTKFKAEVSSLETKVNLDQNISKNEKSIILGATSVARYSAAFWISNPGSRVQFPGPDSDPITSALHRVVKADIVGAVVGGITTGGAGILPGAIVGSFAECVLWGLDFL